MNKLNFGCGTRFAAGWTNIDFHSSAKEVQRVNLLAGFPFPDRAFDVVYSSHVLEHFTPEQAAFLVSEAWRVLKAGGILRTVLPDLEDSCREYMRVLKLDDSDPKKQQLYKWATIELLDQLVRTNPGGSMGTFMHSVAISGDRQGIEYIQSRTESHLGTQEPPTGSRLTRITPAKLLTKSMYAYLSLIKRLVPKNLRPMVWTGTTIGERHRWMYDKYGLRLLMQSCGFGDIRFLRHDESAIPGFRDDGLDSNQDGTPYKNVSLYCEATKQ